jgi:hypothetical protein
MSAKSLRFSDLCKRHAGVSDGVSAAYSEAVRVCLDRHHTSPAEFQLKDNSINEVASVKWLSADQKTIRAWANKDDATRDAAYGLALAAIEAMRGMVALGRAETRSGADYYVGLPSSEPSDLEEAFRLEVSGTDEGIGSTITNRLRQKIEQARKGNSNLPAIASVVGFAALQIISADVDTE